MASSIIQLRCDCNNYPWGKQGKESLAARLCVETPGTDFEIDESKNYAEMWMGTYPTTPAYVLSSGELLQDVLNKNQEALIGKSVLSKYGTDLPFLPKVLSIAKALPLQLHPNKGLASQLHKKDPDQFGDDNHKPEIAVAFGPFEVFAGFKNLEDVQDLFQLEPLKQAFNPPSSKWTNDTLRDVCKSMLFAPEDTVKQVSSALLKIPRDRLDSQAYILDLLPRLQEQYSPEDNGNLVALLAMNFLTLQAGDAIYIPADGIHAYLSGDIFECMARSDNVLNVGFCPRASRNNIDTFTETLTFRSVDKSSVLLPSKPAPSTLSKTGKSILYAPPMGEFNVIVTSLTLVGATETVGKIDGPSIMLVLSGGGHLEVRGETKEIQTGFIFFIGHGVEVGIECGTPDLVIYRAYAE